MVPSADGNGTAALIKGQGGGVSLPTCDFTIYLKIKINSFIVIIVTLCKTG